MDLYGNIFNLASAATLNKKEDKMSLNFTCPKDKLQEVETFLFSQSFDEKPCYETIIIETEDENYFYSFRQEFGK